jgi:hypothetical protein
MLTPVLKKKKKADENAAHRDVHSDSACDSGSGGNAAKPGHAAMRLPKSASTPSPSWPSWPSTTSTKKRGPTNSGEYRQHKKIRPADGEGIKKRPYMPASLARLAAPEPSAAIRTKVTASQPLGYSHRARVRRPSGFVGARECVSGTGRWRQCDD